MPIRLSEKNAMNKPCPSCRTPGAESRRPRFARSFFGLALIFTLTGALRAQTPPAEPVAPPPAAVSGAPQPATETGTGERRQRGNFNPADMQARLLAGLRTQLGVTDDAEWTLISDRVMKVFELRRAAGGGFGGFPGRNNRTGAGATADPEGDALRAAITDNLPDAEIKARLARVRDVRKQNEAKLDQAREDLRAVLTVRQEAVAVMFGLLN